MGERAGTGAAQHRPTARFLPSHLDAFGGALRKRLKDRRPQLAKRFLDILVEEIVINGIRQRFGAVRTGSGPRAEEAGLDQVPRFVGKWRARQDSNL
jgi:hypothetical protein